MRSLYGPEDLTRAALLIKSAALNYHHWNTAKECFTHWLGWVNALKWVGLEASILSSFIWTAEGVKPVLASGALWSCTCSWTFFFLPFWKEASAKYGYKGIVDRASYMWGMCIWPELCPRPGASCLHHPVGAHERLPLLHLPLPLLAAGRGVLAGAPQGQDPAGRGRGERNDTDTDTQTPYPNLGHIDHTIHTHTHTTHHTTSPKRTTLRTRLWLQVGFHCVLQCA